MPDLKVLKDLLDRITRGNEEVRKDVEACKALLDKISRTTAHVHIEINYNGKEFSWKVPQLNMTASEWTPPELREKRPSY